MFKKDIASLILKALKNIGITKNIKDITSLIEIPIYEFGDYAFPCFSLSKELKKTPEDIAKLLKEKILEIKEEKRDFIDKIKTIKGYLNISIKGNYFAERILNKIFNEKENFGKGKKKNKRIVVESPGPNTNKPLHLGHLRNMALGIAISKILKFYGNEVINVDIINDRGIHIAKSMLAYKKFGKGKKPNKKPDHFVGDFYVLYSQKEKEHPELEDELRALLKKYESGDKEVIGLLKKMNSWALKGIKETYKRFGMHIDKFYFETQHYEEGKRIVLKYLKKGVFKKEPDGTIIADLTKQGLGKKVLLRADGTSLYITQDIALAIRRWHDFKPDKMIYIVASEQIYHFKVLFSILRLMGFSFVDKCLHFPYGMVYLPEGKMKSREGKIVDADNLIDEVKRLAEKEILKREPGISKKELEERAEKIALGAIKFFILKYDALKDFIYYPEKSLSFEGETGPYLQYAYARASSILRKANEMKEKITFNKDVLEIKEPEEKKLLRELSKFPEVIKKAAENLRPERIANYAYTLAKTFTEFYTNLKVLTEKEKERKERLQLVAATRQVLGNALTLLDISPLEKM